MALFLRLVARPACLPRTPACVRGIGSLYYLSYAIAHGLTVKPLLERYWRK
ncbi:MULTISPECIES: hypothetical protein [unclassified Janthinobacterium]|uniref:hypothetical protein n=1 Tax=unclassified Janthinobacterium TaxID=2610881 RepID=UPI001C57E70A|nr:MULTISPECIES: hypothetical protein [unclassified Janthinobacterium]QYG07917.1 hypothetical protein KY494_03660 [Janthinobacterium sp. PAMC25594]